jgi:hypothetical protein
MAAPLSHQTNRSKQMDDRKMKLIEMLALSKHKEELAELMEESIEDPFGFWIKLAKRRQQQGANK